jgi:hypothetical protein
MYFHLDNSQTFQDFETETKKPQFDLLRNKKDYPNSDSLK